MTAFVLFVYLKFGYTGSLVFQEFDTRAACENALAAIRTQVKPKVSGCVPKRID